LIRDHTYKDLVSVPQEPEPAVPAVEKPKENAEAQTDFQKDGIDARYLERDRKRAEMMKTSVRHVTLGISFVQGFVNWKNTRCFFAHC